MTDRLTLIICAEGGGPEGKGCICAAKGYPNEFIKPCARLRAMVREGLEREGRAA